MTRNVLKAIAYMFHRKGFLTKKLVVATITLMMMLYIDAACHIWDGMGVMLLVLLSIYVTGLYAIRYLEMKRIDEEQQKEKKAETHDGVGERMVNETEEERRQKPISGMEKGNNDGDECGNETVTETKDGGEEREGEDTERETDDEHKKREQNE